MLMLAPVALNAADDEAAPADDTTDRKADEVAGKFRWRVGASFVLSNGSLLTHPKFQNSMPDEGIVGEFALSAKINAPVDGLSAKVRLCWGCHELELEDAFVEYRPDPLIHIRAGRMNVPLGGFNNRHDFSTRRTISKPLTRIMGNMVRQDEFNSGILPAPYVDNGLNVGGKVGIGDFSFNWDAFVMAGLKGFGDDIDFVRSREFRDINGEPSFGGRLELDNPWVTFGVSYIWGNYDPNERRSYQIAAADLRIRAGPLLIEGEVAWRQTEYTKADGDEDQWFKYGWWGQVSWEVYDGLFIVASTDSLFVTDIFLGDNGPTPSATLAVTDDRNRILRVVGGVGYSPWGNIMIRANGEYWEFSDFNDAWVVQVALAWAF
jgi:hypothetical protein